MNQPKDIEVVTPNIGQVLTSLDQNAGVDAVGSRVRFADVTKVAGADAETLVARGKFDSVIITCTKTIAGGGTADGTILYFDVDEQTRLTMTEGTDWVGSAVSNALSAAALAAAINAGNAGGVVARNLGVLASVVGDTVVLTTLPRTTQIHVIGADGAGGGTAFVLSGLLGTKKVRVLDFNIYCVGTTQTVTFEGNAGGTAITGVIPVATATMFADSDADFGLFETAPGTSLYIKDTSGAADGGLNGRLTYCLV